MEYLADTNVAVRRLLPADPWHHEAKAAVEILLVQHDVVYVPPQCLVEFQALATRPIAANGLGLTPIGANTMAADIEAFFPMLHEGPGIYAHWRNLMSTFDVRGRQVYTARLVAVMLAHGITHLLTFNASHFRRYNGIVVVEPADIAVQP